jgi:hypothetical protein
VPPSKRRDDSGNACCVLDVIHPLWLCAKQTNYRKEEGRPWAVQQIKRILKSWQPGTGFSTEFNTGFGTGFSFELEKRFASGLMGTEMWLSILYLLTAYLGISDILGYSPKGVHRTEPALNIIEPV